MVCLTVIPSRAYSGLGPVRLRRRISLSLPRFENRRCARSVDRLQSAVIDQGHEVLHFIFPCNPLAPHEPEELFSQQFHLLANGGFTTSLLPDSDLVSPVRLKKVPPGTQVVYRGWMLTATEYNNFASSVETVHAEPFISPTEYLATHHLPIWYPLVRDFTPETKIYAADSDLVTELQKLNWQSFFIKDYVKSLKTSVGSLIHDANQISKVIAEMIHFRGEIEGGICVRRVEPFVTNSEVRYFVINGKAFSPELNTEIPKIVTDCAQRIPSKFFSIDIIKRKDGKLRVVEIGDGQVSDLVGWTPERFAEVWKITATTH